MKRALTTLGFLGMLTLSLGGAAWSGQEDIDQHKACVHCGMDRKAFDYSRMLVQYADGSSVGTCSIHCVAIELNAKKGPKVTAILVADRDTRELLAAEKAVWVMGGSKKGVMTAVPKWAFAKKEAADAFVKENGGKIVSWEDALQAAQKEISGPMMKKHPGSHSDAGMPGGKATP